LKDEHDFQMDLQDEIDSRHKTNRNVLLADYLNMPKTDIFFRIAQTLSA
jgi:hypothetical protein